MTGWTREPLPTGLRRRPIARVRPADARRGPGPAHPAAEHGRRRRAEPRMRRSIRSALAGLAVAWLAVSAAQRLQGRRQQRHRRRLRATLTIQGDAGNPTLVENFNPFLHRDRDARHEPDLRAAGDSAARSTAASRRTWPPATRSPDPTKLVFTLRQGVKWSDGTTVHRRRCHLHVRPAQEVPGAGPAGIWAQLSAVSTTADTVTVTFKKPNVPFAGVLAAHTDRAQALCRPWPTRPSTPNTTPVGTGPFILASSRLRSTP